MHAAAVVASLRNGGFQRRRGIGIGGEPRTELRELPVRIGRRRQQRQCADALAGLGQQIEREQAVEGMRDHVDGPSAMLGEANEFAACSSEQGAVGLRVSGAAMAG